MQIVSVQLEVSSGSIICCTIGVYNTNNSGAKLAVVVNHEMCRK